MAGNKLAQAKSGAEDFAKGAIQTGYKVGIIAFADDARIASEVQNNVSEVSSAIAGLNAAGGTNLTAAILLGLSRLQDNSAWRTLVLVTDGQPNDRGAAIAAAKRVAEAGIQVITIGTDDADVVFLREVASFPDLAKHVTSNQLAQSIAGTTKLLGRGQRGR